VKVHTFIREVRGTVREVTVYGTETAAKRGVEAWLAKRAAVDRDDALRDVLAAEGFMGAIVLFNRRTDTEHLALLEREVRFE
jgi:hypothetical protein